MLRVMLPVRWAMENQRDLVPLVSLVGATVALQCTYFGRQNDTSLVFKKLTNGVYVMVTKIKIFNSNIFQQHRSFRCDLMNGSANVAHFDGLMKIDAAELKTRYTDTFLHASVIK